MVWSAKVMKNIETFIALNRFGLGPAPREANDVEDDPKAWVKAQISPRVAIPRPLVKFRNSDDIIRDIHMTRQKGANKSPEKKQDLRAEFAQELLARSKNMIVTATPFTERMVMFWSNHFTVSTTKKLTGPVLPAFEREAIRPHIFGKFSDMLEDVARHPAMLAYLDNHLSAGPRTPVGIEKIVRSGVRTTLNENLAREILELHTLGVNGGYNQDDVIELAKAISGWSHGGIRLHYDDRPVHGRFEFKKEMHEPGSKTVLGKRYKDKGANTGLNILDDLARHPSTARHIATKLVRHFVSDDPPPNLVAKIAKVFMETDGDLAKVTEAIVDLDEVWIDPLPKVKSHYELVISAYRVSGQSDVGVMNLVEPLREFGQLPFSAASPAGWPDEASHWVSPEGLMRRVEWLDKFARKLPTTLNPEHVQDEIMGPVVSDNTRLWVSRAPSVSAGLSLILASPEFQRR